MEEIQLVVLNWIDTFLDLSPLSILPYGPRFLSVLLPTMAHDNDKLRKAAERVNKKMLNLILSLPDNEDSEEGKPAEKSNLLFPAIMMAMQHLILSTMTMIKMAKGSLTILQQ